MRNTRMSSISRTNHYLRLFHSVTLLYRQIISMNELVFFELGYKMDLLYMPTVQEIFCV